MRLSETTSAEKILQAATELFTDNHFNNVSIKDIANRSGVNSALISYYFGGKKNLYQEVLNQQSEFFFQLIDSVNQQSLSPLAKLHSYIDGIINLQKKDPNRIHLIYRELVIPSAMYDNFVKTRLLKIHQFITELAAAGMENGSICANIQPRHVAFTLESLIVFFFLTQNQICDLENSQTNDKDNYLQNALHSYLSTITND